MSRESWEAQFAKDFPRGLLMTWDDGDSDGLYHMGLVHILEADGLMPHVQIFVLGVDKGFEFKMETYEVVQRDPLVMRVHFRGDEGRAALWSANVPENRKAEDLV